MSPVFSGFRFLRHAGSSLALVLIASCAAAPTTPPPLAGATPIPPGNARVWFYRVFFPDDTGDMPAVYVNGITIGYAKAGTSFYRDLPAGAYQVTVDSFGKDQYQSQYVTLAPGGQQYLTIQSAPTWIADFSGARRPTHYVAILEPRIATLQLSQTSFSSGY